MSHTLRIYNNPRIKKAQRYNLDDPNTIDHNGIVIKQQVGIPFTHRSWLCMGKCKMCCDPNKEPRLIRKRNKEQFRFQLKEELRCHKSQMDMTDI